MKIFAIRDEHDVDAKDLAYLLYYEGEKRFYIELPEGADPWETPLLLDSFVRRGDKTVNSYWSKLWVQQRIVPPDRQNLGMLLKENSLDEYDEFGLLMLAMGRCAQDDYYLEPLNELPNEISKRFLKRIEDVVPLEKFQLLVFFRDGKVKKCNLRPLFYSDQAFRVLLNHEEYFDYVQIQTGGHGVTWDVNVDVSDEALYQMGIDVPLSGADFRRFVEQRVVTVAEAAEILGCSRQNVDDLTRRGKLHPVKSIGKTTLYFKSEILRRNWK